MKVLMKLQKLLASNKQEYLQQLEVGTKKAMDSNGVIIKTKTMEYKGKLYGKIGDKTFDTGKTSDDWDSMELENKKLKSLLQNIVAEFQPMKILNGHKKGELIFEAEQYLKTLK